MSNLRAFPQCTYARDPESIIFAAIKKTNWLELDVWYYIMVVCLNRSNRMIFNKHNYNREVFRLFPEQKVSFL